jgi:hypothetical protein
MGVTMTFNNLVVPSLMIEYYAFSFLTLIYLILPARHNPGKNNYEAIYYTLIKTRTVFHSISIIETLKGTASAKEDVINVNNEKTAEVINTKNDRSKIKIKSRKKSSVLVKAIEVSKGDIIVLKNKKMFYVKTIDYLSRNFEAYKILNSKLDNLLVKNTIPFKSEDGAFLTNKSTLSLKKNYLVNCDDVKEVKGILPSEAQGTIDSIIDFLKSKDQLQDKILN